MPSITTLLSSLALTTHLCSASPSAARKPHESFICPKSTSPHASVPQVRHVMEDFVYLFYTAKDVPKAFNDYVAENYIQHNANILSGRQPALDALTPLFSSPDNEFDVKRLTIGRDGSGESMVVVHLEATNTGGSATTKTVVIDMYRLEGSCIVEHWDVLQPESADATNPLAYF